MQIYSCLGCESLITLITWITEHGVEVLGLNMISCAVAALVRILVAESAVELLVRRILPNKLEQVTGRLEKVS